MAQETRPKAIYVGPEKVGTVLKNFYGKKWEFTAIVKRIDELFEGLGDGSINNDVQILLVMDTFFDPTGQNHDFETLVATMAPYCFLAIVNYHPELTDHMREQIQSEAISTNADMSKLHYYFIDPKKPNPSMDAAVSQFALDSQDDALVQALTGVDNSSRGATAISEVSPTTQHNNSVSQYNEPQYNNVENTSSSNEPQYIDDDGVARMGQIVAVTSSKGGSGKSTVAISLAAYLAQSSIASAKNGVESRPLKIIVVDLDVRDGQVGFMTNHTKPTVIALRLHGITKENLAATVIHDERLQCDLLLAPRRPKHANDTPPEFYVELLQQLRSNYDYVILDTSVSYLDPLLEKVAYPMSDQIIFVTDITINSVFSMTRWTQEVISSPEVGGMGIPDSKIAVVVNKYLTDVNMDINQIKRAAQDLAIISVIPSQPKLIAHATNTNNIQMLLRHEALSNSIGRIARGVVNGKYKLTNL